MRLAFAALSVGIAWYLWLMYDAKRIDQLKRLEFAKYLRETGRIDG